MINNKTSAAIRSNTRHPPANNKNLEKKIPMAFSFLKKTREIKIVLIKSLNTAVMKIRDMKFLCSERMILPKVVTGVSIIPAIVFQRSILNILSLRYELHFLQILS
jgi:hypothetical protein